MSNKTLSKIKDAGGYWYIIITSNKHKEERIPSRSKCKQLVAESEVSLRGWPYPYTKTQDVSIKGNDFIVGECDWPEGPFYEYWRFYQEGTFVHYFPIRTDLRMGKEDIENIKRNQRIEADEVDKVLNILSSLYSITEIYKFASNLAATNYYDSDMRVVIKLFNVKNRMLYFGDAMRSLFGPYICRFEDEGYIETARVIDIEDLISSYDEIAMDVAEEFFENFNWNKFPRDVLKEDQDKLLEKRLY